jgi:hypothetical protein
MELRTKVLGIFEEKIWNIRLVRKLSVGGLIGQLVLAYFLPVWSMFTNFLGVYNFPKFGTLK